MKGHFDMLGVTAVMILSSVSALGQEKEEAVGTERERIKSLACNEANSGHARQWRT